MSERLWTRRDDLEFTMSLVLRGIERQHPRYRKKSMIDADEAVALVRKLIEAMQRDGYTITDSSGQVVIEGRPKGPSHSIST